MRSLTLILGAAVILLGRQVQSVPDPDGQVVKSEKQTFKIEVVARDLETPWALAFLPDGRMLVTERPGRLRIIENGKLRPDPVKGLPAVWEKQDGGLLDVEVHPDYARNGWIYLSYSETLAGSTPAPPADPPTMTVIVRGKINKANEWVEQQVLFRAPAPIYNVSNAHYGSRFIFDKDRHLFFSLGDKMQMMDAQDLSKPTGKIHRINDDGTVPKDNPFVNRADAVPTIWSLGHRNPQGLAWDPVSGKLWESEHGPSGGDEINIVEKGHNYGWGVITMGTQAGITKQSEPGMEQPVVYYTPTLAPSGLAFYTGTRYPAWKNNLFVGGLGGQQLRRLEISGDTVSHQEVVFNQFGRVRDVVVGPDGYLYVLLQRPGQVLTQSTPGVLARLIPVEPSAEQPPMHVYIRAGLKTHGPGQHDYPQYLADWSKVLTERGAIVDGSLHFPTSAELVGTDVMVMYKGDAGAMTADEKSTLEAYLTRGGGLVSFHDTLCGPDPDYYSTIVGGAKKHGQVNYTLEADVPYTIVDSSHPIVQGMSNFTIKDEAFFLITWSKSPAIHVLATATMAATPSAKGHEGEVVPQIWTYERSLAGGQPYRAFVWMQGHNYANFTDPRIQPMLLRGIAWAAKRPVDALMTVRPRT